MVYLAYKNLTDLKSTSRIPVNLQETFRTNLSPSVTRVNYYRDHDTSEVSVKNEDKTSEAEASLTQTLEDVNITRYNEFRDEDATIIYDIDEEQVSSNRWDIS